jgi:hypothetical protein
MDGVREVRYAGSNPTTLYHNGFDPNFKITNDTALFSDVE